MSFPGSPSSSSADESPLGVSKQLSTTSASIANNALASAAAAANSNAFVAGEALMTPTGNGPTPASSGAVRRKPARRANTAERRATHNAVERQRRETLNSRFLDLAALLPNLANVRRPSKSAIVNSSIALVHTQRRLRAIAARELRSIVHEADLLRREVNEWRSAHPMDPVPSARASSPSSNESEPLELIMEPPRSAEFIALFEADTSAAEDTMNEQERIAYEMRGGDSGPMGASIDDGDEDGLGLGGQGGYPGNASEEDSFSNAQQPMSAGPYAQAHDGFPGMQLPASQPTGANIFGANQQQQQQAAQAQQQADSEAAVQSGNRARAQSLNVPRHLYDQQAAVAQQQQAQAQQQQQMQMQQHLASLLPHQAQQYALQLQQQQAMHSLGMPSSAPVHGFAHQQAQGQQQFSGAPSFDAIAAAAAGFPHLGMPMGMPGMGMPFHPYAAAAAYQQQLQQQQQGQSEQDAAKLAAWNAHLFSAALVAQQQARDLAFQQAQAQAQGSAHGSPFAHNVDSVDDAASASTPASSSGGGVPPSLTLSISSSGSSSSGMGSPVGAGMSGLGLGGGVPSSLPSALASPLHNLSLGNAQGAPFAYGSAPSSAGAWGAMQQQGGAAKTNGGSPPGTPGANANGTSVGGGGGMGGYAGGYPLMSVFI